ncbi:MAG: PKD domain-containing protein [Bacteroidetes bacterium]|nr:PKD domain-containing protein [Bacteroidota bacterium]
MVNNYEPDSLGFALSFGGSSLPCIYPTCNAEFIIIPDTSQTGLYYGYNLSTGNNLIYTWNWGDGTTSTGQLPSHTYSDSGYYQICLTILDTIAACQDTFVRTIKFSNHLIY